MTDGLVKLYELPDIQPRLQQMHSAGYQVRPALACEKAGVCQWVEARFGDAWLGECEVAFAQCPVTCFIATHSKQMIGFACYEVTMKNFFGPIGVSEQHRSMGIGGALLVSSLLAMRAMGYGYAIVGGLNEKVSAFYHKTVDLELIAGSEPGIYANLLRAGPRRSFIQKSGP